MKLYYSPGACSLAPHIILHETGLKFEALKVDLKSKQVNGQNYLDVNPKGSVPAVELENKEVLTEVAVILQYLAELAPNKKLFPTSGMARVRAQEFLNFIATDIHKGMSPLWSDAANEEYKTVVRERVKTRIAIANEALEGKEYLLGTFSVADAYLFTVLRWTPKLKVDISGLSAVLGFFERMKTRPAVNAAMTTEGLR